MPETNYASGDEYMVEFLGWRFGFNAVDFEQRVSAAAVKLGLVEPRDLEPEESADLVELASEARIAEPQSPLGEYLVRHWEQLSIVDGESLVYWLRKLVFRSAWLDMHDVALTASWTHGPLDVSATQRWRRGFRGTETSQSACRMA